MQRLDPNQKESKRVTVRITDEQAEYIEALIGEGVYKNAAEYVRDLINLDMEKS